MATLSHAGWHEPEPGGVLADGYPGRELRFVWDEAFEAPVLLRMGAVLLVDPPEYFCTRCGFIYLVQIEAQPERCPLCYHSELVQDRANSERLHALRRALDARLQAEADAINSRSVAHG